jgi:hypothetical protein
VAADADGGAGGVDVTRHLLPDLLPAHLPDRRAARAVEIVIGLVVSTTAQIARAT